MQRMVSARVCLIYSLSPFLSAFFANLFLGETLTRRKWFGMAIGFLGLAPLFRDGFLSYMDPEASFSWGEVAVVGAVVAAVNGWILLGKFLRENDSSPVVANGYSMVLGGVLALEDTEVLRG